MTVREIPVFTEKDKARFWSKVRKGESETDCWLWVAGKFSTGYGQFRVGGRMLSAHKISFILHGGTFDNGPLVLHGPCHRRDCCNPLHLYSGTYRQNEADKKRDNTAAIGIRNGMKTRPESIRRGSDGPSAKLTDSQVIEIRSRRENGERLNSIGRIYGVSDDAIRKIVLRKTWSHV